MTDTRTLQVLRKYLLSPYKKYLLYNDKGEYAKIDYDKFHEDHKDCLFAAKTELFANLSVAAAIYKAVKELDTESLDRAVAEFKYDT